MTEDELRVRVRDVVGAPIWQVFLLKRRRRRAFVLLAASIVALLGPTGVIFWLIAHDSPQARCACHQFTEWLPLVLGLVLGLFFTSMHLLERHLMVAEGPTGVYAVSASRWMMHPQELLAVLGPDDLLAETRGGKPRLVIAGERFSIDPATAEELAEVGERWRRRQMVP